MSAAAAPAGDVRPTGAARVGVALSGGGHRASLFALGALLYLIDAGKGPQITAISSVSGGSLTNGFAGLGGDLGSESPAEFRGRMRPLAQACATRGSLFRGGMAYVYIAGLAALGLLIVVAAAWADGWWSALVLLAGLALLAWLATWRDRVAEYAFDRTLFHRAPLSAMTPSPEHVICATDLQTAEHLYFSGGFIQSYRLGRGTPGSFTVARAVQCSSALPGGFFPRRLSTSGMGFPHVEALPHLLLTDGGVYDNMGTEWFLGDERRSRADAVTELIVVNGSAGRGVRERRLAALPLVGEVAQLSAANGVLYDQTTAVRRRWLRRLFGDPASGLDGVLVQIDRSPTALPERFAPYGGARGARATAALDRLGSVPAAEWLADAAADAGVKTTLSAVGGERAARLVRHAYALTMANAHVLLDYPLLEVPDLRILQEWVS